MVLFVLLSFTACNIGDGFDEIDPEPEIAVSPKIVQLARFNSCDAFVSDYRDVLKEYVDSYLDNYTDCSSYEFGDDVIEASMDSDGATTSSEVGSSSEVNFTGTNLQEADVDEADLMKTDGEYIYLATIDGVDIYKAWPLVEFSLKTSVALDYAASELFLYEDKLVSMSSYRDDADYYMQFTRINVIDISDPATPIIEETKDLPGSYLSSRLVDGVLHVALASATNYSLEYPAYDYNDKSAGCTGDSSAMARLEIAINSARAVNYANIDELTIDDVIVSNEATVDVPIDCTNLYGDGAEGVKNITGLFSLNLNSQTKQEKLSFVRGYAAHVYASTQSVYLAGTEGYNNTYFHRFGINANSLHAYTGSGAVSGYIKDSFSMSEYENTFRIATTVGSTWSVSTMYNNVYVLDATKAEIAELGRVEKLAEDEWIYAVRFIRDKGYVVTFKKVDPLFVIDLSEPTNPKVAGELKIPGFSTYLHVLDDDHIIGLGKDAEDMSSFAWFQGVKLAVFDVSDPGTPSVADDLIIGGRGSDSEALYEHRAFNFDATSGILALPITLYENSNGESDYGEFSYVGVHLYHIDPDTGIETLAEVPLGDTYTTGIYRTMMIGDDDEQGLYVLSSDSLYLLDMNDDYKQLAKESVDPACGSYWCGSYWW